MNAIVAANSDWGIGYGGTQSVVIPEDRRYFKRITVGGVVIAGRKTFEDFRKPLPDRKNIIMTRSKDLRICGAVIAYSIDDLLSEIEFDDPDKVFVIGGGDIYSMLLPLCACAYVTKIKAAPPSDTFFPNLDKAENWLIDRNWHTQNSGKAEQVYNGISYSFERYVRIRR